MLRRISAMSQEERGFTLIELMVVVIIIAVLAAIAIPLYTGYIRNARTTEATARMGAIMTAAKAYAQRYATWPTAFGVPDFYGDNSPTKHFTYAITAGQGSDASTTPFQLAADGQAVDGMGNVWVYMRCANSAAEGSVWVTGL